LQGPQIDLCGNRYDLARFADEQVLLYCVDLSNKQTMQNVMLHLVR
jgi:hypothetical protein